MFEMRTGDDAPWHPAGSTAAEAIQATAELASRHGGLAYLRYDREYVGRIEDGRLARLSKSYALRDLVSHLLDVEAEGRPE